MRHSTLALLCCVIAAAVGPAAAEETRLLRMPDVSAARVAFVHAGDVWLADRDGGEARRLTTFDGFESSPKFSPDGRLVAFSGKYDGNVDVYVVGVEGGEPRRLTWHPGRRRRPRLDSRRRPRGVRVGARDGAAIAAEAVDRRPAGRPARGAAPAARRRRHALARRRKPGLPAGRTLGCGVAQLPRRAGPAHPHRRPRDARGDRRLPWDGSNDLAPVWLGGTIFFLSDRDLAMNVWAYDVATGALAQRTRFKEFDCKNLGGGAGSPRLRERRPALHARRRGRRGPSRDGDPRTATSPGPGRTGWTSPS